MHMARSIRLRIAEPDSQQVEKAAGKVSKKTAKLNQRSKQIAGARLKHGPAHQEADGEGEKHRAENDCRAAAPAQEEVAAARQEPRDHGDQDGRTNGCRNSSVL